MYTLCGRPSVRQSWSISADEINEGVWPGRIVSAETIAQRVKMVRQLLGDNAARSVDLSDLWLPEMREFRADARFRPLVDRLRFTEYWQTFALSPDADVP